MTERRFKDLDDLVLDLKGLVLVRDILRDRGTDVHELETEIVHIREELAEQVKLAA
jgi:hypothetical protein